MELDDLVKHYPRLYHMAAVGSWDSIYKNGLMTTRQLVEECITDEEAQAAILAAIRPQTVVLTHPDGHEVSVRDQAPLRDIFLPNCLVGVSKHEWLDILNGRVFFWLHPAKLSELLNARRYRAHQHDVITVDTRSLVETHQSNIRLSPVNSGAVLYPNSKPRGQFTFMTVTEYPLRIGPKGGGVKSAITELAVIDGVPDIANHVVRVERRQGATVLDVMYP